MHSKNNSTCQVLLAHNATRDNHVADAGQVLLLTEQDAAKRLGFSAAKLKGLRKARKIGYVQTGRLIRYRPETLESWIAAQEVRGG